MKILRLWPRLRKVDSETELNQAKAVEVMAGAEQKEADVPLKDAQANKADAEAEATRRGDDEGEDE